MLRMRRTVAFSSRVHTYVLLLYIFCFMVASLQLWWDTTTLFTTLMLRLTTLCAVVGSIYALIIFSIAVLLFVTGGTFATVEVVLAALKLFVFVFLQLAVFLFYGASGNGLSVLIGG
jgi:hypothetical protein